MKQLYILALFVILSASTTVGQVAVNTDGSLPDNSAMLDIKSTNKGLLPPRVALTAINSAEPLSTPAFGLLVFNTGNAGTSPNNVIVGYYYWNGTKWISVTVPPGANSGEMLYWNGTQWVIVSAGKNGQLLTFNNGVPEWGQTPAQLPTLITSVLSEISPVSAKSGGCISDGGSVITSKGVCWSTLQNPTIADNTTNNGVGTECYMSMLTGLTPNMTYYIRAYATNSAGIGYGNELSFNTQNSIITLTTTAVSDITAFTASSGGNILNEGGAPVTERGVCWSTTSDPTILDSKTNDGIGSGSYTSNLTGLTSNTSYYVRAYATNSFGTCYGNQESLTTLSCNIILSTTALLNLTAFTATSGGNIISDGGSPIIEKGVCWSISSGPTIDDSKTNDGAGIGLFTSNITGLASNKTYYVRAYATNSLGTCYGNELSFTTKNGIIALNTVTPTSITAFTATSGGAISDDGGDFVIDRGICWSTSSNPTTADNKTTNGTGVGYYQSNMTSLIANTIYYVRAYAINSFGTCYGNQCSFITMDGVITLLTYNLSGIKGVTANSGGNIISDGGASITAYGVCWSTTHNPTTANSKTMDGSWSNPNYTSHLSGLSVSTTFYVRAYATNCFGTGYGNEWSFTTNSTISLGEDYAGGIVFYVDGTGVHGLIAATSDLWWGNFGPSWGCPGILVGTSTTLGTGQANTSAIVNECGPQAMAAYMCDTSAMNGYSDWFLPSKDELNQMYLQHSLFGYWQMSHYCWSSSEYDKDNAWIQDLPFGSQNYTGKNGNSGVRAIRAF